MKKNYKPSGGHVIGIITSIAALLWLAQIYDVKDLTGPLGSANYWYLLLAVCISVLDYLLRSLRWGVLFLEYKPGKISSLFRALMQGYLFNILLPARAGELIRAHRLSKDEGIPLGTVIGTLVVERVGDMIFLIILLIAFFLLYPDFPEWVNYAGSLMVLITIIATVVLAAVHFHGHRLKPALITLLKNFLSEGLASKLEGSGKMFVEGLSGLFRAKSIIWFLAITVILWAFAGLLAYYVAGSLGLWVPLGDLLFVMIVIVVGTMVPSSPGYIGVYELFGVAGLELVGISGGVALSFIVMLHATTILVPGVIGSLCLFRWDGKSVMLSQQGVEKE
jgi:uncharacterized protein (TIRG00374 family)|tara:strand:+ start:205 stop:1209 length:1005 start_codon:yes stop_codon:yes gene_type:complete